MDPQMSSVLAARVALERLARTDQEPAAREHRRSGTLVRLTRLISARFTHPIRSRRAPARTRGPQPLGSGSHG